MAGSTLRRSRCLDVKVTPSQVRAAPACTGRRSSAGHAGRSHSAGGEPVCNRCRGRGLGARRERAGHCGVLRLWLEEGDVADPWLRSARRRVDRECASHAHKRHQRGHRIVAERGDCGWFVEIGTQIGGPASVDSLDPYSAGPYHAPETSTRLLSLARSGIRRRQNVWAAGGAPCNAAAGP